MTEKPKALAPVKIGGKLVPAGADIDPGQIAPTRLGRLAAKGRATLGAEPAALNRAEVETGRPDFEIPPKSGDKK
ncbi:hypothetical protein [Falsiruegeria litorea]|uniref:hypothetical protein n=1 Tax=Falsiruegeria litorea TaxID=1280831 RepID=UPI001BFD0D24|nr:hypothetical protein [Falsiruegeria litorea]MBT8169877.1 hypothetical protein [Falsiruegeria litorea]